MEKQNKDIIDMDTTDMDKIAISQMKIKSKEIS